MCLPVLEALRELHTSRREKHRGAILLAEDERFPQETGKGRQFKTTCVVAGLFSCLGHFTFLFGKRDRWVENIADRLNNCENIQVASK